MAERAMSGVELQAWQRRASPFARLAFVVYVVLVVYASLAPWSGWRDLGISAFAYLSAPWPKHVTQFDVIVNVLGYLPFGALGVLAAHPRARPLVAVAGVALAGVMLSGAIEALQTFVPRRIASQVDLLANGVGALAGAWLTAPFAAALIDRGRLLQLRARWFSRHASPLLVLLALWWFAQIYPTPMLFAFGSSDGGLLETARDLGFGLPARGNWSAADFVLAEAVVATAGVLAAGLAAAAAMTLHAPRLRLLLAFIFMALAMKSLAYGVRFGPERWLAWVTPGAVGGLALGLLALMVAATGRQRAIARLALAATLCLLLAVGLVPDNPYFSNWIEQWRTGRLTHFNAAAESIALAWPFALSVWLVFASLGKRP